MSTFNSSFRLKSRWSFDPSTEFFELEQVFLGWRRIFKKRWFCFFFVRKTGTGQIPEKQNRFNRKKVNLNLNRDTSSFVFNDFLWRHRTVHRSQECSTWQDIFDTDQCIRIRAGQPYWHTRFVSIARAKQNLLTFSFAKHNLAWQWADVHQQRASHDP